MKLPEVLAALEREMPTHASWRVVVLTRKNHEAATDDNILAFPVFEISVDDADAEINLLTDEDAQVARLATDGMTVGQLLDGLTKLGEQCVDYSVYSGSAQVPVDNKYEVRCDSPLIGVARNPEAQVYGFLQWPPEQWETTA
jgi:hypothetical protein